MSESWESRRKRLVKVREGFSESLRNISLRYVEDETRLSLDALRALDRAYKGSNIEVQVGGKSSPIHILRHAGINRLIFLNYSLIDITNKVGHASPDTTNGSYIHLYPFQQQQFLAKHYQEREIHITQQMLGGLAGLSDRRIRQIFIDNKIARINSIAQVVDFLSKFQNYYQ
jgi:hypothetical protein